MNNSDSRHSNSLFQIARGSGATLSECTFFSKKSAHHSECFFKTDGVRATRQKEPEHSIRALFDKEPGYMLGSPSTKNQGNFKKRPSSSLCQTARGSGATSKWGYFFQKDTRHAKILRSTTRFRSRKHSDDACSCSTRLEGTRRGFQNSTMKCSRACRS